MFEYLENVNMEIDGIMLEKGYDFYEFNSNSIENFCRKILFLVVQRNIFRIDARAIINNIKKTSVGNIRDCSNVQQGCFARWMRSCVTR